MYRKRAHPSKQILAKKMRKNPTPAERKLWRVLRRRQLEGLKFRRQEVVLGYIVDFYCPRLKLAVEIDGTYHSTLSQERYDEKRDFHLRQYGIRTLRFRNEDVYDNLDEVLEAISFLAPLDNPNST